MPETRIGDIDWNPIGEERRLLEDVVQEAELPAHTTADDATSAVLCVLAERISAGEARQVLDGLPAGMRALLSPCAHHGERPAELLDRSGFIRRIAEHLKIDREAATRVTRAVFAAARKRLPEREIRGVSSQLPADLEDLWMGEDRPVPPKAVFTGRAPAEAAPVPPPDRELDHPLTREVARSGELPAGATGAGALGAVLCILSQRLTAGDARHFLELPAELHPILGGCIESRPEEGGRFGSTEYLRRLGAHLGCDEDRAAAVAQAGMSAAKSVLSERAIEAIAAQLPPDLESLWRSA